MISFNKIDKNYLINKFFRYLVHSISFLRTMFWRTFLKKIGKRTYIMSRVIIMSPQKVEIGHDVLINADTKIGGQAGIKIGNFVQLGYNVNLVSVNHSYKNSTLPIKKQGEYGGTIFIEDDVWVGANAVILPNVIIGKGAIVGANAVVTKDVKPYSIVGGVPAKHIKYRFPTRLIKKPIK